MSNERVDIKSAYDIVNIINNEMGGFNKANAIKTIKPLIQWFITYCEMQPDLGYPHVHTFYWATGTDNSIVIGNAYKDSLVKMNEVGGGYKLKYNKKIGKVVYPVKIERFFWDKGAAILDLTLFDDRKEKNIKYALQMIWYKKQANIYFSQNKKIIGIKGKARSDAIKSKAIIPIMPVGIKGAKSYGMTLDWVKLLLPPAAKSGSTIPPAAKSGSTTSARKLMEPFPEQRVRERIHPTYGKLRY